MFRKLPRSTGLPDNHLFNSGRMLCHGRPLLNCLVVIMQTTRIHFHKSVFIAEDLWMTALHGLHFVNVLNLY